MAEKAYVCQRVGQRGPVHGEILRRGGTVGPVAQQQGQQPGADAQQGPTGNAGSAPKDDGAVDADFHEV